ncbi:MAG: hypothetical protein RBT63_10420 [Bdellovibrionales bacterium]|jgi:hypothetical protein|nr:hypothetical protein [Bdellovibrionales bacterium]
MSEFFFVVKTALLSALLLMVLQMKIGGVTLEKRSEEWIYSSRPGVELQKVARGALRASQEGWQGLQGWFEIRREQKKAASGSSGEEVPKADAKSSSWGNDLD